MCLSSVKQLPALRVTQKTIILQYKSQIQANYFIYTQEKKIIYSSTGEKPFLFGLNEEIESIGVQYSSFLRKGS